MIPKSFSIKLAYWSRKYAALMPQGPVKTPRGYYHGPTGPTNYVDRRMQPAPPPQPPQPPQHKPEQRPEPPRKPFTPPPAWQLQKKRPEPFKKRAEEVRQRKAFYPDPGRQYAYNALHIVPGSPQDPYSQNYRHPGAATPMEHMQGARDAADFF